MMKTNLLILAITLGLTACTVRYDQTPSDTVGTLSVASRDETNAVKRQMYVICVDGYKFVKYTQAAANRPVQILNENGGGVPCQP